MTLCNDITRELAPDMERLNRRIRAVLSSPNQLMNTVIDVYLQRRGKQIRPTLVLLTARLLDGGREVSDRTIEGAVAVELLHNVTLIHDDVVDDTRQRRSAPTINALWDSHLAVLVGDFFLSNALRSSVATQDLRIVDAISQLGRTLAIGELDQLRDAHYAADDEASYFRIIYRKTASLFRTCVEIGAYSVDAAPSRRHVLSEYARLLGLAFQIRDDIFDYFPAEAVGKPTGNDLREGKVTLPLLHVLADASQPGHVEMTTLAQRAELTAQEIERLQAYARDNGGIEYAYARMEMMRHEAVALLEKNFPPSAQRQAFIDLFDYIIRRDL